MIKRLIVPGAIAFLALFGLSPGPAAAAPQEAEKKPSALCGDCHEAEVKAFSTNPHLHIKGAAAPSTSNAVCEGCHGDMTKHIEAAGAEKPGRPVKGREGADGCLTCHDKSSEHVSYRMGIHSSVEAVNCLTCHSIHKSQRTTRLLAKPTAELCATCHFRQADSFKTRPFAHRLGRGGMECTSCHNPHGAAGKDGLRFTRTGELPCLSCHAEKRGPYVFEHVNGVAGDCRSCHEHHGSNNPKQLKRAQVSSLCLECHSTLSTNTLGAQPPSIHNLTTARWQNCTTCHVAVHGSNRSPRLLK